MLHLHRDKLLGKGRQKAVYYHPEDESLCVKIPREGYAHSLKREIRYIQKHQQKIPFIGAYRGEAETNLGQGYLFDVIRDFDGQISRDLEAFMQSEYDRDALADKASLLYELLIENRAPLSELQACNILVRKEEGKNYDLVIIDGFGNSDFIKICDFSRFFLKKKLIRKFTKFCRKTEISPSFLK